MHVCRPRACPAPCPAPPPPLFPPLQHSPSQAANRNIHPNVTSGTTRISKALSSLGEQLIAHAIETSHAERRLHQDPEGLQPDDCGNPLPSAGPPVLAADVRLAGLRPAPAVSQAQ